MSFFGPFWNWPPTPPPAPAPFVRVRALDGLPLPAAAWWPGWQLYVVSGDRLMRVQTEDQSVQQVLRRASSTGQVRARQLIDTAVQNAQDLFALTLFDQSNHDRDLTALVSPAPPDNGAPFECTADGVPSRFNLSLILAYSSNGNRMTRADALGLASDPALTIAWNGFIFNDPLQRANLLALGDAAAPELNVWLEIAFDEDTHDRVALTNLAGDLGGMWILDPGTVSSLHNYVLTKPSGSGYDSGGWRLILDGADLGAPTALGTGALALGSALTQLGDVPVGDFHLLGQIGGCIVWDIVLDEDQIAQLADFMFSV